MRSISTKDFIPKLPLRHKVKKQQQWIDRTDEYCSYNNMLRILKQDKLWTFKRCVETAGQKKCL